MSVVDSVVSLVESVFAYEVGDPGFNITVGISVFAWVLVARIFMAMFPTKRGIIAAFFAFAVPMAFGLLAYGLAETHLVPLLDQNWTVRAVPWIAFGLLTFLSILVFAKRIWSLSVGVSIFIYIVATSAAIGAYFGAQVTMGVIDFGGRQVEQREQRTQDGLDSIL